eukprot:gnl/MRDRNA2_/MRDRNA2_72391_c0_seq1.p1 gnl/MRDRNA2_/MRDRNA2_72391_c0~~gnl/MRDRNA2_/MRDRNA2_72391_c0_seq1.p1  ORF type:complete len:663 (+),score=142.29 gnl/MRDRNA2_/MRDRNA2_72391_c0_seq1:166-2154(+)
MSFYRVLGVDPAASTQEIKMAFKRCALSMHPDKGGTSLRFQEAMEAFEVLVDAQRRAEHDHALAVGLVKENNMQLTKRARRRCSRERSQCDNTRLIGPNQKRRKTLSTRRTAAAVERSYSSKTELQLLVEDPTGSVPAADVDSSCLLRRTFAVARLYKLLQQICPEKRRAVLSQKFSEAQRLALEKWILSQQLSKRAADSEMDAQDIKQVHCQTARSGALEETLAGSNQNCVHSLELVGSIESPGCVGSEVKGVVGQNQKSTKREKSWCRPGKKIKYAQRHSHDPEEREHQCNQERPLRESSKALQQPTSAARSFNACKKSGRVGRAKVRGISSHCVHGCVRYTAKISCGMIRLFTREVQDLGLAVEFLMILCSIRQHVMKSCSMQSDDKQGNAFEVGLREAIHSVLQQHHVMEHDLGLRFHVVIPTQRWLGTKLVTPTFRLVDLDCGLWAWRQLRDARGQIKQGNHIAALRSPEGLQQTWARVRETFLCVLDRLGHCKSRGAEWLTAREEKHRPLLDRAFESWNRTAMAREERQQHRASAVQQRWHRAALHMDATEKRRMKKAERRRRLAMVTEHRIDFWLARWKRGGERESKALVQRQAQKVRRSKQLQQQRLCAKAAADRAAQRAEERRLRGERKARWDKMNNRDLTMGQILSEWKTRD